MMAVELSDSATRGELKPSAPWELFAGLSVINPHSYDVTADGRRFLVVTNRAIVSSSASTPIVVVLNWK